MKFFQSLELHGQISNRVQMKKRKITVANRYVSLNHQGHHRVRKNVTVSR